MWKAESAGASYQACHLSFETVASTDDSEEMEMSGDSLIDLTDLNENTFEFKAKLNCLDDVQKLETFLMLHNYEFFKVISAISDHLSVCMSFCLRLLNCE